MSDKYIIPFNGRSHNYTEEEIELVSDIMRNADTFTQGKYLKQFEKDLSEYFKVDHVFAISNATCALELVAKLLFIKPGDEIIVPSHTYTSSVYPFIKSGAKIVFSDIDLDTRVITVKEIEKCFTDKTRAVIVPHLYGYMAQMDEIERFAYIKGIKIIEDCAQSFGTSLNGKQSGTFGHFGVYSFHSQKNITTLGEGGALVVKDKELAELIPQLRHNGHRDYTSQEREYQDIDYNSFEYYWHPAMTNVVMPEYKGNKIFPDNFCMDEVKCALGSSLIKRIDIINHKKRKHAIQFMDAIGFYEPEKLIFHREDSLRHCYHILTARVDMGSRSSEKRNQIMKILSEKYKIQCAVQYMPLYRYDFYKKLKLEDAPHLYNNSEIFYDTMISFPFYEVMFDRMEYMVDSLKKTLEEV